MNLFGTSNKHLLEQADKQLTALADEQSRLLELKDSKLRRQVELWSILNLNPTLEEEYYLVSSTISEAANRLLEIDSKSEAFRLARYHCQEGSCDRLQKLINTEVISNIH